MKNWSFSKYQSLNFKTKSGSEIFISKYLDHILCKSSSIQKKYTFFKQCLWRVSRNKSSLNSFLRTTLLCQKYVRKSHPQLSCRMSSWITFCVHFCKLKQWSTFWVCTQKFWSAFTSSAYTRDDMWHLEYTALWYTTTLKPSSTCNLKC